MDHEYEKGLKKKITQEALIGTEHKGHSVDLC